MELVKNNTLQIAKYPVILISEGQTTIKKEMEKNV